MKKTLSVLFIVVTTVAILAGCGGPNAATKKNLVWWSGFTRKTVVSADTIRPYGDVPHTLLKIQSRSLF